ncbi:hypothetical protein [Actinoplanes derwentensis]|uniref:hypothetical protein n=1 Tax=Actinoplanes derwentensis TaxID=113562 RepID=UPI0012FD060A|nr:hypothetical protein [Actinoplanes derwentensis]GID87831.1 hypothetical protein Ade03nite_67550 [Actinoplanes derwentensis]
MSATTASTVSSSHVDQPQHPGSEHLPESLRTEGTVGRVGDDESVAIDDRFAEALNRAVDIASQGRYRIQHIRARCPERGTAVIHCELITVGYGRIPRCQSTSAFRGSFHLLCQSGRHGDNAGFYLLRFYAVECGLKAAILTRMSARSTAQLPDRLRSHDLRALALELRLSPAETRGISPCETRDSAFQRLAPSQVHEAWRYGARLSPTTEKAFVAGLDSLIEWCRKELGR